jgi:hypothetical protein
VLRLDSQCGLGGRKMRNRVEDCDGSWGDCSRQGSWASGLDEMSGAEKQRKHNSKGAKAE